MALTVSAAIITYNGASLLPAAIDSVYAQSVVPTEVLVVDDGSTDDTAELLRHLDAKLPPSFRWVTQANAGEACARNRAVELAKGELIAWLDHDDLWREDKIRLQVEQCAREPDLSASVSAYEITQPGHRPRPVCHESWESDPDSLRAQLVRSCIPGPPSTALMRTDALRRLPPFDEHIRPWGCDWLMWLRMASAGMRIGYVPEPLLEYRYHGTNMTRSSAQSYDMACAVMERFFSADPRPVPFEGRSRSPAWWRARWHLIAAISARQDGDMSRSRRHIVRAARIRPASIRTGWVRMLGVGPAPRVPVARLGGGD